MADLQAEMEIVSSVTLTRFCQLAAMSMTIYDHVLTFDDEVRLIWRKPWSFATLLYLLVRYLGDTTFIVATAVWLSNGMSATVCYHYFLFESWMSTPLIWVMQVIMQMRIFALYGRSIKVAAFTGLLFVCEIVANVVMLSRIYSKKHGVSAVTIPIPGVAVCSMVNIPSFFGFWSLPFICFETVLFLLALWIGIRHVQDMRKWTFTGILRIILRDSLFYFAAVLSAYVISMSLWMTLGSIYIQITEGFAISASVIMGSRLVLNMRAAFWFSPRGVSAVTDASELNVIVPYPSESDNSTSTRKYTPSPRGHRPTSTDSDMELSVRR
ncbi:hypothetical protein PLICRDRAFT_156014 [Plicaturopsis crispa FD-325 SS-3]|nr:hypothetical protein PLICRDRAFT_156014 [Plicaturopsis crispa FD-325 SS-3]